MRASQRLYVRGSRCTSRATGASIVGVSDDSISPLREPPVRGVENLNGSVVLHLAGELDLYNADEVRAALSDALAQSPERIVVDMAEVEFVDSTALGVLIEA